MHAYMLYLPEEWLRSGGLRSFPLDRPPNVVNTWRQFLYTGSVELIVGWREEKLENQWNGEMIPMPKCV